VRENTRGTDNNVVYRSVGRLESRSARTCVVEPGARNFSLFLLYDARSDTRHAANVAYAVSGVRSGLRVNSRTKTFSNWTW